MLYRFAITAIAIAIVAAAAGTFVTQFLQDSDSTFERTVDSDTLVRVERVIDGDTFVIAGGERVRLYGVQAPELGNRCGDEARERLEELVRGGVRLEDGPRTHGPHGRRLAYAFTAGGDSIDSIDETLVSEGLAKAWTRDGQYRDSLAAAEAGASGMGCDFSFGS